MGRINLLIRFFPVKRKEFLNAYLRAQLAIGAVSIFFLLLCLLWRFEKAALLYVFATLLYMCCVLMLLKKHAHEKDLRSKHVRLFIAVRLWLSTAAALHLLLMLFELKKVLMNKATYLKRALAGWTAATSVFLAYTGLDIYWSLQLRKLTAKPLHRELS